MTGVLHAKAGREMQTGKYEAVIIWKAGKSSIHACDTRKEAQDVSVMMFDAFGGQIDCVIIRPKGSTYGRWGTRNANRGANNNAIKERI